MVMVMIMLYFMPSERSFLPPHKGDFSTILDKIGRHEMEQVRVKKSSYLCGFLGFLGTKKPPDEIRRF